MIALEENLNSTQRAQLESIVSSVINLTNSIKKTTFSKFDENARIRIRNLVLDAVEETHDDESDWIRVCLNMKYDTYLEMREEEGTATDYDMVRPGLVPAQFTSDFAYKEHLGRISEHQKEYGGSPKICSSCGRTKSNSKFKRGGGSVCNACRCRIYRENKKQELKSFREQMKI